MPVLIVVDDAGHAKQFRAYLEKIPGFPSGCGGPI
jgi:hypothetical protein